MTKRLLYLLTISVLSLAFVPKDRIILHSLPNGLRIIILPRNELNLVSIQLWLKIGSVNDGDKPGLMHLVEHMLFNGSSRYPPGAIDEKIEEMGGKISAETGQDFTYFSVDITPEFLPQAIDILSDLVQHPLFPEDELDREKRVVIAEIKGASNPFQEAAWRLARLIFNHHPYGNPIPGNEDTLKGITRDDILSAWQKYYHPDEASLIVVGDVDPQTVITLTEKKFGDWQNASSQIEPFEAQQPFKKIVRASFSYRVSSPPGEMGARSYIALGFPAPGIEDIKGVIALDILHQIIEDGKLFTSFKENGWVSEIHSFFLTQKYPSVFIIYASTWSDIMDKVEKGIITELQQFIPSINEERLEKAKKSLIFSYFCSCETYSAQAHMLGFYESIADFSFACDYPELIEKISLNEVKAKLAQFIRPDVYCLVSLTPQK